ncbi:MAG: FtsQ-type POTRA domain-containing protein [Ruminococcaceae bacterium]|nr:FtsQ-type POTRA domain-containing protein [Oscillospiraceae bacterium]
MAKKKAAPKKGVKKPVQNVQRRPVQQSAQSAPANSAAKRPAGIQPKKAAKPAAKKPVARRTKQKQPSAPKQEAQQSRTPLLQRSPMTSAAKKQTTAAMKKRGKKKAKRGSRGGNYSLYYIFAAVVLIIVFIILANTVLFDCTAIEVEGNTTYDSEKIAEISGISLGDNLMKADLEAAEQSIVTTFPYIDMAEVKRVSPTKIKITITEAEKWYCMRYGSRSYIISRRGKIVEQGVDASLPVVIGYEPSSPEVGGMLTSGVEGKTNIPSTILKAAEEAGVSNITTLNITDRFEIEMVVDGRITMRLGNTTELESKMNIAKEFAENIVGETESVTIDIRNPEKVPKRDSNVIDNPVVVPVAPESSTAESTAEATAEAQTQE